MNKTVYVDPQFASLHYCCNNQWNKVKLPSIELKHSHCCSKAVTRVTTPPHTKRTLDLRLEQNAIIRY